MEVKLVKELMQMCSDEFFLYLYLFICMRRICSSDYKDL